MSISLGTVLPALPPSQAFDTVIYAAGGSIFPKQQEHDWEISVTGARLLMLGSSRSFGNLHRLQPGYFCLTVQQSLKHAPVEKTGR